jgi:hypothetical protein
VSAWQLARVPGKRVLVESDDSDFAKFVGLLLKWIPADLVVLYTAFIKALVDDPTDDPNVYLTIIFGVSAPIVVLLLAANSDHGARGWTLALRTILVVPAFALWTLTVPNSGWDQIDKIAAHPTWVAGLAAFGAFLFSLLAEFIERRVT